MSIEIQPTLSRLPAWLRSADDTAAPAGAGAKDLRPVFADPSGRRRVLVRGTAATLAVASVAFMAGAGLLLANQPLPAVPYIIGGVTAGDLDGRPQAAIGDGAAGPVNLSPGAVLVQPVPRPGTDVGARPEAVRQPAGQPAAASDGGVATVAVGLLTPADTAPTAGPPAEPASPPQAANPPAANPPAADPPPAAPPAAVPPAAPPADAPAEQPGLLAPVLAPVTGLVGSLLDALL